MYNFFREWGALLLTGFIILLAIFNISKGGKDLCVSNTFNTYYSKSAGCLLEVQKGKWQSINSNQGK